MSDDIFGDIYGEPKDEYSGIFRDDGTRIDPNLIPKPSLCLTCKNDDTQDPEENILCLLNRADQEDEEEEFECGAYEKKEPSNQ
jgi:hypothetical protein